MPPNIRDFKGSKIHVKLLCGADLLESFAKPGLWSQEDVCLKFKVEISYRLQ